VLSGVPVPIGNRIAAHLEAGSARRDVSPRLQFGDGGKSSSRSLSCQVNLPVIATPPGAFKLKVQAQLEKCFASYFRVELRVTGRASGRLWRRAPGSPHSEHCRMQSLPVSLLFYMIIRVNLNLRLGVTWPRAALSLRLQVQA